MMWDGDGVGWWMWIPMTIMMVVFWGAIIGLIVWAVQAGARRDHHHHQEESPLSDAQPPADIAKERYARGEIGREEFERIMSDLGPSSPTRLRV